MSGVEDDKAIVLSEGKPLTKGQLRQALLEQSLSPEQVEFLMQRTPKSEIKHRSGRGGMQFSYVEHGYVTERLNIVFGFNWDFEVVDKQMLDEEVVVEAKLTVRTPGGQTIVKTQFGGADIKRHASGAKSGKPLSIADDYKAAASDALKKCASLLGIGLDLYGTDRQHDAPEPEPKTQAMYKKDARKIVVQKAREAGMDEEAIRDRIRKLTGGNSWDELDPSSAMDVANAF